MVTVEIQIGDVDSAHAGIAVQVNSIDHMPTLNFTLNRPISQVHHVTFGTQHILHDAFAAEVAEVIVARRTVTLIVTLHRCELSRAAVAEECCATDRDSP